MEYIYIVFTFWKCKTLFIITQLYFNPIDVSITIILEIKTISNIQTTTENNFNQVHYLWDSKFIIKSQSITNFSLRMALQNHSKQLMSQKIYYSLDEFLNDTLD